MGAIGIDVKALTIFVISIDPDHVAHMRIEHDCIGYLDGQLQRGAIRAGTQITDHIRRQRCVV